ncbi:hypothetical protein [Desulfurella sp.]|uniref:hypothetical protein n=1 Tax=Desulfurella sp. TaxID=1962857 RepID=UPI003D0E1701
MYIFINMEEKRFSIDIVLKKTKRWNFKEILIEKNIVYCEWFMELNEDVSIISVDVNIEELEDLYDFILNQLSESRIVLPNGTRLKAKLPFDIIKTKLVK